MTTVDGVMRRYKRALKSLKKNGSMKRAFEYLGVDRNTIVRTAPIAEVNIIFPDIFEGLSKDSHEKISTFTERCREAITAEMASTLTHKKNAGELLPITYKMT